MEDHNLEQNDS